MEVCACVQARMLARHEAQLQCSELPANLVPIVRNELRDVYEQFLEKTFEVLVQWCGGSVTCDVWWQACLKLMLPNVKTTLGG